MCSIVASDASRRTRALMFSSSCAPINIPPLGSKNIVHPGDLSEVLDDLNAGHWADSDSEDEGFEVMALDSRAAEQVRQVNNKSVGPGSVPLPYSPGESPPAYPLSSPVPSFSSSPCRPLPRRSDGAIKSYMSRTKADTRMCMDSFFRNRVLIAMIRGYIKVWYNHPAWRSMTIGECIAILLGFHPPAPGAVMPPMTWMMQLGGQMLNQLNSTMGLPKRVTTTIAVVIPKPNCLRFGIDLPTHVDHINTVLGHAWVAWNSQIGVSRDVWAVLSTAWTHCHDCDLVWTFEGDQAHRDARFLC
ncbi:hypothetical protein C8F04DRAFT_1190753 [Mycena alexandri]|uniref:Uncharacterized protein n=1 Tax=Mycena alexandri TaxID=1745969 RepID=A0AAD6SDZ8_9AGAR|nr:hypothetical protein C8F04DRAFT_1190753 [Mycena alexandri]